MAAAYASTPGPSNDGAERLGVVYTGGQKGLRVYQGILHRKGELPWEVGVNAYAKAEA